MADVSLYAPKLIIYEGGYVNNPNDKGGCTKYGITIATAEKYGLDKNGDGIVDCSDVQELTPQDFKEVLKKGYWDIWMADQIQNQSIAELLVDWLYNSGLSGVLIPQRILGVQVDGVPGPATIAAVNSIDQESFFNDVKQARSDFYDRLGVKNTNDQVFEKGWHNRLNQFVFKA